MPNLNQNTRQLLDFYCHFCVNLISQVCLPSLALLHNDKHPIINPDRTACRKWARQLVWKAIAMNYRLCNVIHCLLLVHLYMHHVCLCLSACRRPL